MSDLEENLPQEEESSKNTYADSIDIRAIKKALHEKPGNKHMEIIYTNPVWFDETFEDTKMLDAINDFHHTKLADEEENWEDRSDPKLIWWLKKIFSIANIDRSGEIGTKQFKQVLGLLDIPCTDEELVKMMAIMDEDDSGTIGFDEFALGMTARLDEEFLEIAAEIELGAMGTRKWSQGGMIWNSNNNILIIVCGFFLVALLEFAFILVPLTLSYFLTFLLMPIMNLFEKRPLTCVGGKQFCQRKEAKDTGCFYDQEADEAGREKDAIKMKSVYECVMLYKFPHIVSVLACLFVVLGTLGGIVNMLVTEMTRFFDDPAVMQEMENLEESWDQFLNDSGIIILPDPDYHDGYYMSELMEYVAVAGDYINFVVMVFLFLVYLMVEKDADEAMFQGDSQALEEIESMIEHYITLKTALSIATGAVVAIILLIIGIQLAVLFGVFTFLLNFIPNIGSMMAMVLPLPVVLLDSSLETWQQVAAFVGPGLVQGYVGNILEPTVFGASLNMTALSILAALVIWGSIWGLTGAVLSVPLLGIIKILFHHTNHPLAKYCLMLIREDPTLDEEAERHGGLKPREEETEEVEDSEEKDEE